MKKRIKYKFALDCDLNEIINIENITAESRHKVYKCISCNQSLIPRLGKIKVHHFAHKKESGCNQETYLHELAKITLFKSLKKHIKNKEPLYLKSKSGEVCDSLDLDGPCIFNSKIIFIDILKYYCKVDIEKKYENFIPDILLYGAKKMKPIFFEIKVSHGCEVDKINSGNYVIEIPIENENEATAIDKLEFSLLREDQNADEKKQIQYYNFRTQLKSVDYSNSDCCERSRNFVLLKNGISLLITNKELRKINPKRYQLVIKIACDDYHFSFLNQIIDCYRMGLNVRNCQLCKFHKLISSHTSVVICWKKGKTKKENGGSFSQDDIIKKLVKASSAGSCKNYLPDENCFSTQEEYDKSYRICSSFGDYEFEEKIREKFFRIHKL